MNEQLAVIDVQQSLFDLKDLANEEHRLAIQSGNSMILHAFNAGAALQAAKNLMRHGEWLPWLEGNFEGTERMAQRYMMIASNPTRVSDLEEPSLRKALKAITQDSNEERREKVIQNLTSIEALEAKEISGVYDVMVIDPPWPMEKIEREVAPNQVGFDYPTMSLGEIEDEVGGIVDKHAYADCHLFIWTTHKFLPDALRLIDEWGLKYVCTFVWHKPGGFQPFGLPQYNCEFAIYARKGSPKFVDTSAFPVCFNAPRGAHSEKPEEFYETLRRVTAGRRIDVYNRRPIDGFDVWGKEA